MNLSRMRSLLLTILASLFLFCGAVTTLSIVMSLHLGHSIGWQHYAYAFMSFALSYGIFERYYWVVYATALNAAAQLLILIMKAAQGYTQPSLIAALLSLLLASVAFGITFFYLKKPQRSPSATATGCIFLVCWVSVISYSVYML